VLFRSGALPRCIKLFTTWCGGGLRHGLGAELGISNSKLHARGPMGLEGLLTYKHKLHGSGQTVTDYAQGGRIFKHRRR